ncbi:Uncharacterised protein [Mycobacteroides abscessus subsp. abscessus]|nr:Uncharacterised protein [Mycobacteroides abscessus subsp. abscessus]
MGVIGTPANPAGDLDQSAFGKYVVVGANDSCVDIRECYASFEDGGG